MNRGVRVVDRILLAALGAALAACGLAAVVWGAGGVREVDGVAVGGTLDVRSARALTDEPTAAWWPALLGVVGVALVVLALAWLGRHVPRHAPSRLAVAGDGTGDTMTAVAPVAAAAARRVAEAGPDVHAARARLVVEGGLPVIQVRARIAADADLGRVAAAADAAAVQARAALPREDLAMRTELLASTGRADSSG